MGSPQEREQNGSQTTIYNTREKSAVCLSTPGKEADTASATKSLEGYVTKESKFVHNKNGENVSQQSSQKCETEKVQSSCNLAVSDVVTNTNPNLNVKAIPNKSLKDTKSSKPTHFESPSKKMNSKRRHSEVNGHQRTKSPPFARSISQPSTGKKLALNSDVGKSGDESGGGRASSKRKHKKRASVCQSEVKRIRIDGVPTGVGKTVDEDGHEMAESQTEHKPQHSVNGAKKEMKFRYGNYLHYYGYRTPQAEVDPRLSVMQPNWFTDRDVLDVGCNVGQISIAIARDFKAKSVLGMDIDDSLITRANHNINYQHSLKPNGNSNIPAMPTNFPISFLICHGPIQPAVPERKTFPNNISFVTQNIVELVDLEPKYDTILCLSVVKWIHLNWGDKGVYTFFKNCLMLLRPGGLLVFEPQPWKSYRKKRHMHPSFMPTYKSIKFLPDQFMGFLTSEEGGFTHVDTADVIESSNKGFCRPIYVLKKKSMEHTTKDKSSNLLKATETQKKPTTS
eukprot:CFRG2882T1